MWTNFRVTDSRLALHEDPYPTIFEICCSLVHFDIQQMGNPRRAADGDFYLRPTSLAVEKRRRENGVPTPTRGSALGGTRRWPGSGQTGMIIRPATE
jgi:hypothetical protein